MLNKIFMNLSIKNGNYNFIAHMCNVILICIKLLEKFLYKFIERLISKFIKIHILKILFFAIWNIFIFF